MTPTNLTQLKKYIKPGMVLTRSHSAFRPEPHPAVVEKTQGNAFVSRIDGTRSWAHYGAAKDYTFTPDGFTQIIPGIGSVTYLYPAGGEQ